MTHTPPDTSSVADRAVDPDRPTVALVSLGCARNDVDSEELAGRLEAGGFTLVEDADGADAVLVNTCGFVDVAKKDSVDTILAAADLRDEGHSKAVVAVGCLAERYGQDLAESLPEADAVLGFDHYPQIADRVRDVLAGHAPVPHVPSDRRKLLPIAPAERSDTAVVVPGHSVSAPDLPADAAPASGPRAVRRRLGDGPMAPLKLASGCDRRCAFCAIPSFRGSFVSRRPSDVLGEARWLAEQGARELFLVSENSTSYGKDLGDLTLLETLLPELASLDGVDLVRLSYLQPAETRPSLLDTIATTPGVADYFDLSFQHASGPLLRRMRRFGDAESFLGLLEQVRTRAPRAGVRSNFIVGFPGETERDLETLCDFVAEARLDVAGVFGYSDEEGTEAETYPGKLDEAEIAARVEHLTSLVEDVTARRAEERIGERVRVLVEQVEDDLVEGRAEHQGPEVDGVTTLSGVEARIGDMVEAEVVAADGVDLVAVATGGRRLTGRATRSPRAGETDDVRGGCRERHRDATAPRVSNWNVPNALTTLRILMVPFFGYALLVDGGESSGWRWVAYGLFLVAMITDKIDGDLARKHGLVTDFGKIADPIADKALTGMAFVGLSLIGELWWWVTIVVLVREWGITLMRFWLIRSGVVMPAGRGGKLKTTVQTIALALLVAPLLMLPDGWAPLGEFLWGVGVAAMGVAVVLTVVTGLDYVRDTLRARREQLRGASTQSR